MREACGLRGGEGCELSVTAPAPLASRHRTATQILKGTNLRSLDSAWIFSSGLLPVRRSLRALCQSPQRHQAVFMGTGSRHARASSHSLADDMKLRQHHAHCEAKSSDILLYLAGVNEHAVLRIVGSKRWSVAHLLRTIQYLFGYGVRFLAT
jgi:hypothetical protein